MRNHIIKKKDIRVLITAGPTREPIDAVRHISNFATGKLGIEIAKEAYYRGYDINLLYGYGQIEVPQYIHTERFSTTKSLLDKVLAKIKETDVYISTAAISDYMPIYEDKKISSDRDELIIKLKPTPKVLKEAKLIAKKDCIFVAFKLGYNLTESELLKQAIENYSEVADIVIANDLVNIQNSKQEAIILYKGQIVNRTHNKEELSKAIFCFLENNVLYLKNNGNNKYYGRLRSDLPSNRKNIRYIINKNRKLSLNIFEKTFSEKILFDIKYILDNSWANEISMEDFFHGHASFKSYISLTGDLDVDLRTIISKENIDLMYHTKEQIKSRGSDWNIYSPSDGLPMVINPLSIVRGVIYFHYYFKIVKNGRYILLPNKVYQEKKRISIKCTMMEQ